MAEGHNFKRQLVGPEDTSIGVIGRAYWKYRSTEPMVPHPTRPNGARLLTPGEHAKAKGVDPRLIEGLVSTTAHEVLGQGVIPACFRAVGAALGRALLAKPAAGTGDGDLPLFASLAAVA